MHVAICAGAKSGESVTELEAEELYDLLVDEIAARQSDVDGLVDWNDFLNAVSAEIALGKPVPVRLKLRREQVIQDPVAGERRAEGTSRGDFIQRQEFTPREKLLILLESLGLTMVAPPLMAQRILGTLNALSAEADVAAFRLADDLTPSPQRLVALSEVDEAVEQAKALRNILEKIREDALGDSSSVKGS